MTITVDRVAAPENLITASGEVRHAALHKSLLACGIASAALYPLADVLAGLRYPGYSFVDQAVSELFAIGAPTSGFLVPLFSLSSTLLLVFALGVWLSARRRRWVRVMAVMIAANAVDALVLWNFFPMHMRGEGPTFTDTMHALLAINPFVLAMLVFGAVAYRNWFRFYSMSTIALTLVLSVIGFSYIPAIIAQQPTSWMGITERAAQYTTNLWIAVLAVVLLREQRAARSMTELIRHHPLLSYLALTFAISWAGLVIAVGPGGLPVNRERAGSQMVLLFLPLIAAPAIAGILMKSLMDGRAGLRDLLSRLIRWRVSPRWYAVALLPIPLAMIAASLAFTSAFDFPLLLFATDEKLGLVLSYATAALLVATFEEIGWTGFAIPRLRMRHGVFASGLLLGIAWGAWHFPMFWNAESFGGALPAALLLAQLFSWLPPFRVLMVWLYERTGSLLLAVLMHATVTFVAMVFEPLTTSVPLLLASVLVLASVQWTAVSALAVPNCSRIALGAGIASAILYAAMLVFVPMRWDDYSSASQTVSELSAIDAPTRSLWIPVGMAWALLYAAFGWGVWKSAGSSRALRVTGGSILAGAVFSLFWPPMHLREVLAAGGATLTDTLHIVWTSANGVFTLLAMGFAAGAFGSKFRVYSILTILIVLASGVLTSIDAPRLQANLPTPLIGVWERVNIAAWLLWVVLLAAIMLRRTPTSSLAHTTVRGPPLHLGQVASRASRR